ncbi:MAG: peptidoglycan-binding domain-containing protein, partial [Clostridia bacterium]|nr:peptidoglycan-binding domain-containing protein [Clostridia bacterium]
NTEAKRKVFGYAIADGVAKYLGVKMPSTSKPTTLSKPTTAAVKVEAPDLKDYLKEGDKNLAVYSYKQLLALLKKKGIIAQGVDNNEIFGAGTRTATKQVQLAAGITVDGLAGPQTIRACYVLAAK